MAKKNSIIYGNGRNTIRKALEITSKQQGELYNRVVCQTTFRNTPHGKEEIFSLEAFKQLLVEADADFPDIFRTLPYPNQSQRILSAHDYAEIVKLFYDWKIKWLGES